MPITLPSIKNIKFDNDIMSFNVENINVSLINAIRRTIISDIPTIVFKTYPNEVNQANFIKNTTRLHNEILKQRLSCIPIHIKELDVDLNDYIVECNVKNDTDTIMFVTTKDFKIKSITTDTYLKETDRDTIFPPNKITGDYILFARLRPHISDEMPGEELHFEAKMNFASSSDDGAYNVVSTCSYKMTSDIDLQNSTWDAKEKELQKNGLTKTEINDDKKNWFLHDAQRLYKENAFDFIIKSIGVFTEQEIIQKACNIIIDKLIHLRNKSNDQTIVINKTTSQMEAYDIILNNQDYTIGKVIEYVLHYKYYKELSKLSYVSFSKIHPHDDFVVIRISFNHLDQTTYSYPDSKNLIYLYLTDCCDELIKIYNSFVSYI